MPDLGPVVHSFIPFAPAVIVLCLLYLIGNDVLDVLLLVKKGSPLNATIIVQTLTADVANRQAISMAVGAAMTAVALGGDFRSAYVTALIAVAGANVGSFESSTIAKIKQLFSSTPPVVAQPAPLARRATKT